MKQRAGDTHVRNVRVVSIAHGGVCDVSIVSIAMVGCVM